jgi:hypothetical protein
LCYYPYFHTFLSAFRKGYGCQTALLKVIEDWKKALDQNKYVAAILMNLSKAVDCLPHDLLILKLKTYDVSPSALNLIDSYLKNRKQCVKVGPHISNWQAIYKGMPQGSSCLVCLPMSIAWNFSGLAFILLMENQLIKVTLSSSKVEITFFIS